MHDHIETDADTAVGQESRAFREAFAYARENRQMETLTGQQEISESDALRFATDYEAMIEDLPVNRYPDTPAPTPEEFADENALDYWSWTLRPSHGIGRFNDELALMAAHPLTPPRNDDRPDWSDVMRWCDEQRAAQ